MKKSCLIALSSLLLTNCYKKTECGFMRVEERVKDQKGTIIYSDFYFIVPDSDTTGRIVACNLPLEYKIDSLRVMYDGFYLEPQANVHYAGSPFHLKNILKE
ncbi:MAG: hypothetical protein ACLGGV_02840 [Bacteroidia bacterium]